MEASWIEELDNGRFCVVCGNPAKYECIGNSREAGDDSTALIVCEVADREAAENILSDLLAGRL